MNKWVIEIKESYIIGEQIIKKSIPIAIPPTNGDRVDIIGESGKYYYNSSVGAFSEKLSKDEYLDKCLPGLKGKERFEALKNVDFVPKRLEDSIAIVIEIKKGIITINGK